MSYDDITPMVERKKFEKDKFVVIKEEKVPDKEESNFGTLLQIYSYQGGIPKIRLRRYGVDRNNRAILEDRVNIYNPDNALKVSKLLEQMANDVESMVSSKTQ